MEDGALPISREARLRERFRVALAGKGVAHSEDAVGFAVAFVRLVLRVSIASAEDLAARRDAVQLVTGQRTQLGADDVAALLLLAELPEFRAVVEEGELAAFIARFGDSAGRMIREEEASELDLEGFARTYGTGEALLLLDALFHVITSNGGLDRNVLRRLEAAAIDLGIDGMLFAALRRKHDAPHAGGEWTVALTGDRIRIGRSPGGDIVLSDPQVALRHADLVRTDNGGWRIVDQESGRPTVLNGRPVASSPVNHGDEVRVGPCILHIEPGGTDLRIRTDRSFAALSARRLTRRIGEVSLLDDLSFTVFSGEVVAMIGPSGCGKTTLLNAIAGVKTADSGQVLFDGEDFHTLLRAERQRVGIVPQDDIVHPELTVEESLTFGARLRFGSNTTDVEIEGEVNRVLNELGIDHIRRSRIGDALRRGISGGQRKRVNLGQELLSRSTRVLFLDEPTSGLDPRASQDIVRLVRQLADRGRIVFIVTHDLTPQVIAQVDHLMVLAPGGRLAFFGPPQAACKYFGVQTPDAIFNRFSDKQPAEWGDAYRLSADARVYVLAREHLLTLEGARPASQTAPTPPPRRSGVKQVQTLVRRYALVKGRDVGGLIVLLAQAPILAGVMKIVFRAPTKEMLFMLSLSCLWFGMSASVRELISDRVIWLRERRVGVRPVPYLGSKVVVLGALVGAQCAAFALMNMLLHPSMFHNGFGAFSLMGVAALTGICGMTLGLVVSALNQSSEGAVGMLPLLLIPQISFSGLLLSLRHMSGFSHAITNLNPARYAYDAMLKVGTRIASVPERGTGDWVIREVKGDLYNLGFKPAAPDDMGLSMGQLCARLIAFGVLFLSVALWRVWRRKAD